MPRRTDIDDDDDFLEDGDDPESELSEEDKRRFDSETRTCPECKADVWDEIAICPKCGHAFDDGTRGRTPWWVLAGAILTLAAVLLFVFR